MPSDVELNAAAAAALVGSLPRTIVECRVNYGVCLAFGACDELLDY